MSDYIERNCAKCNSFLHHEDHCPPPCQGGGGEHCGKGDCLKCDHVETLSKLWDATMLLKRCNVFLSNTLGLDSVLVSDIQNFLDNRNQ